MIIINAIIKVIFSVCIIIVSDRAWFVHLCCKGKTLDSHFWNTWSDFIKSDKLVYFGYSLLLLIFIQILISFIASKQTKITDSKPFKNITRIKSILSLTFLLGFIYNDVNYTVESIILIFTINILLDFLFQLSSLINIRIFNISSQNIIHNFSVATYIFISLIYSVFFITVSNSMEFSGIINIDNIMIISTVVIMILTLLYVALYFAPKKNNRIIIMEKSVQLSSNSIYVILIILLFISFVNKVNTMIIFNIIVIIHWVLTLSLSVAGLFVKSKQK